MLVHSPQAVYETFSQREGEINPSLISAAAGSQRSVISAPIHHFPQQTESLRDEGVGGGGLGSIPSLKLSQQPQNLFF